MFVSWLSLTELRDSLPETADSCRMCSAYIANIYIGCRECSPACPFFLVFFFFSPPPSPLPLHSSSPFLSQSPLKSCHARVQFTFPLHNAAMPGMSVFFHHVCFSGRESGLSVPPSHAVCGGVLEEHVCKNCILERQACLDMEEFSCHVTKKYTCWEGAFGRELFMECF